ncbi:hypothetical protein KCU62_g171, partial [Aureobasidium sp. EXF-3399]
LHVNESFGIQKTVTMLVRAIKTSLYFDFFCSSLCSRRQSFRRAFAFSRYDSAMDCQLSASDGSVSMSFWHCSSLQEETVLRKLKSRKADGGFSMGAFRDATVPFPQHPGRRSR